MGIVVRKKEGESPNTLIFRFTKKVQQSGVLREVKGRRFTKRPANRNRRRQSAIYKARQRVALEKARKLGRA